MQRSGVAKAAVKWRRLPVGCNSFSSPYALGFGLSIDSITLEQKGSAWFISGLSNTPGMHSVDLEFEGKPLWPPIRPGMVESWRPIAQMDIL